MSDSEQNLDAFAQRFMPLQTFVKERLQRPCGKPYSPRTITELVRRDRLPVAMIGEVPFVDLQRLADQMSRDPQFGRGKKRRERVRLDD